MRRENYHIFCANKCVGLNISSLSKLFRPVAADLTKFSHRVGKSCIDENVEWIDPRDKLKFTEMNGFIHNL